MEVSTIGLITLFPLHAVSLSMLGRLRYSKGVTAVIWGILCICCLTVTLLLKAFRPDLWVDSAYLITILLFFVCYAWLSEENTPQMVFLFFLYSSTFLATCIFSEFIVHLFWKDQSLLISTIIRRVLQIGEIFLYLRWGKERFDKVRNAISDGWWPLNLIAVMIQTFEGMIMVAIFMRYPQMREWILILFALTFFGIIYGVLFRTMSLMKKTAEQEEARQREHFLKWQLNMMKSAEEDARRIRHDARHHDLVIADYAKNGKIQELLQYLDEQEAEQRRGANLKFCENRAINSILVSYVSKAEEQGISTSVQADVKQDTGIRDMDLTAILGNLMENAVNGCLTSRKAERRIEVRIHTRSGKLVFTVRNSCSDDLRFQGEKAQVNIRTGTGIQSILRSARLYNGEADFRGENGVFVSRVLVNLHTKYQ